MRYRLTSHVGATPLGQRIVKEDPIPFPLFASLQSSHRHFLNPHSLRSVRPTLPPPECTELADTLLTLSLIAFRCWDLAMGTRKWALPH